MAQNNTSGGTTTKRPRRRLVRLLRVFAIFVFLLAIVVAFLPTILSFGIASSIARSTIASSVNGTVHVGSVDLSWFGPQRIEQIEIESTDQDASVTVTAELSNGLLGLAFAGGEYGTLRVISGTARGVRYEDGSTSLAKLFQKGEPKQRDQSSTKSRDRQPSQPRASNNFIIAVQIDDIDVIVEDRALKRELALMDLAGTVNVDMMRAIDASLDAKTRVGDTSGALTLRSTTTNLFRPNGSLNIETADLDISASLTTFPVAVVDALLGGRAQVSALVGSRVESMSLSMKGTMKDATGSVALRADHARMDGDFSIRDGSLVVEESSPLVASATLTNDAIRSLMSDELVASMGLDAPPALTGEAENSGAPLELRVSRAQLPLPTGGAIDLSGANAQLSGSLRDASIRLSGMPELTSMVVRSLDFDLKSDDLTTDIVITSALDAMLNDRTASGLSVAVTASNVLSSSGAFVFDQAGLTGRIEATSLPTALAQTFVAGTPIVLARDLGPTLDLNATFSEGETKTINLETRARHIHATARANISPDGSVIGEQLDLTAQLSTPLIEAYATRPLRVPREASISLTRFTIPATDRSLRAIGLQGTIDLRGESLLVTPANLNEQANDEDAMPDRADSAPITINSMHLEANADTLGESLTLRGTVDAANATMVFDQAVSRLFNDEGTFDLHRVTPIGTINISGVSRATMAPFTPERILDAASELLSEGLDLTLTTSMNASEQLAADVSLSGRALNGTLRALRTPDGVSLGEGALTMQLTEALVAALQADRNEPISFTAEDLAITTVPGPLLTWTGEQYAFADTTINGTVRWSDARLAQVAALERPVSLRRLDATYTLGIGATRRYALNGRTGVRSASSGAPITNMSFDVALAPIEGMEQLQPDATITLEALRLDNLDPLLGRDGGTLSTWLGSQGNVTITTRPVASGFAGAISTDFPNATGELTIDADEHTIRIAAPKQPTLIARAEALESFFNPEIEPPEDQRAAPGAPSAPASRITVASDLSVALTINSLTLPRTLLAGEPITDDVTSIDVSIVPQAPLTLRRTVVGGRVIGRPAGGAGRDTPLRATLRDLSLALKADTLADVSFQLSGVAQARRNSTNEAGNTTDNDTTRGNRSTIEMQGTVRRLLDAEGVLSLANPVVNLDVSITSFPTWVLDALGGGDSFLSDSLGESVTSTITSRDFSPESGSIVASAQSANGSTADVELYGRNNGISMQEQGGATASLTFSQDLRDRILFKLHPIFADVRATSDKINLTISNAFIPVDGDLRKLNADVRLEVGDIQIETGSQLLRIMQFTQATRRETMPGHISDLNLTIRDGIVRYDNFVVSIDRKPNDEGFRHRITFSGEIDLPRQYVESLIGAYPIKDLASSIEELRVLPGMTTIGVKFFGDMYDEQGEPKELKSEITLGTTGGQPDDPLDAVGNLLEGILRDRTKRNDDKTDK